MSKLSANFYFWVNYAFNGKTTVCKSQFPTGTQKQKIKNNHLKKKKNSNLPKISAQYCIVHPNIKQEVIYLGLNQSF